VLTSYLDEFFPFGEGATLAPYFAISPMFPDFRDDDGSTEEIQAQMERAITRRIRFAHPPKLPSLNEKNCPIWIPQCEDTVQA